MSSSNPQSQSPPGQSTRRVASPTLRRAQHGRGVQRRYIAFPAVKMFETPPGNLVFKNGDQQPAHGGRVPSAGNIATYTPAPDMWVRIPSIST